ncbi:sulfate transporter family protein [Pseudohoeflea coraliihabitans]|uniref:Sulfate transporter family protein n=1 Tax=Pseudohoeflea coraliihabitans TaxID=2860393 RepID=A0ABS6WPV6_9HYPH|nr:sulfate transporter family protein [Pseudohoeflea sp. DP4N28-3]MBW3097668.1 sulfate transporter family protein [Pseudohoeflea sp. DP4N28-3]
MILEAARRGANNLFSPASRSALWKSLGITVLILIGLWFGLGSSFEHFAMPYLEALLPGLPSWAGFLGTLAAIIAGLGLALGLGMLIAPITAIVAGLFLDDVAEVIERNDYAEDSPGRAMPLGPALVQSLKFLFVVIVGNLLALLLLLVPGINIAAFFIVNGYLLGREYFEFAAMRFHTPAEARALRSRHRVRVFLAGMVIAAFLSVPLLNLLTPMFAAAMMVHLYKMTARQSLPASTRGKGARRPRPPGDPSPPQLPTA